MNTLLVFVLTGSVLSDLTKIPEILFIINTQPGDHHEAMANKTHQFLVEQYRKTTDGIIEPDILWSGKDLRHPITLSSWAIFPLSRYSLYSLIVSSSQLK